MGHLAAVVVNRLIQNPRFSAAKFKARRERAIWITTKTDISEIRDQCPLFGRIAQIGRVATKRTK